MYLRMALDFHLPKALIWALDMPLKAAQDAAWMPKLWDLFPDTSRSQKQRESVKALLKRVSWNWREIWAAEKVDLEKFPLNLIMQVIDWQDKLVEPDK